MRVQCVHGNEILYPSAQVRLETDGWGRTMKVALIPEVPVDVLLGVRDSISLGQELKECLTVTTRAQKKTLLANQQQESVQIATDVVPGEGTQSEEDREGDHADSGGAVMPESERLQQTPHSATSNSEGQADILQTDPQQLRDWQQTDSTLQRIRELAASAASHKQTRISFTRRI